MKKIVIHKPCKPEGMALQRSEPPNPGPEKYRIRVHASGVNFADTIIRKGLYQAAKGKFPITPGFEFAGVIDAAGQGARGYQIGQPVFGFTLFGGYASSIVVKPSAIRPIPAGWSFAEAACVPATNLTACHALCNIAHVKAGETILVHSAAGGVGLALLQQARALGCKSIAIVGSKAKVQIAKEFGASHTLLKTHRMWKEIDELAPSGIDVALDANGISTLRPAFRRLKPGGRLVVYGFGEILSRSSRMFLPGIIWNWLRVPRFSPLEMTASNRSIHGLNLAFLSDEPSLAEETFNRVHAWMEEGILKPVPVTEIPVEKVAEAHRLLESGTTVGKLVLTFSDNQD